MSEWMGVVLTVASLAPMLLAVITKLFRLFTRGYVGPNGHGNGRGRGSGDREPRRPKPFAPAGAAAVPLP